MGMQDREWWGDAWKKRDKGDIHGYHYGRSEPVGESPDSRRSPFDGVPLDKRVGRPSGWVPWAIVFARWTWWAVVAFLWLRLIFRFFK